MQTPVSSCDRKHCTTAVCCDTVEMASLRHSDLFMYLTVSCSHHAWMPVYLFPRLLLSMPKNRGYLRYSSGTSGSSWSVSISAGTGVTFGYSFVGAEDNAIWEDLQPVPSVDPAGTVPVTPWMVDEVLTVPNALPLSVKCYSAKWTLQPEWCSH
jgi:hypothetical protein